MGDISLGKVLGQCAGKTIRGVIETPDDIEKGVLTIQFTDGTTIHVYNYIPHDPRGDLREDVRPRLSGVVAFMPEYTKSVANIPNDIVINEDCDTERGNPLRDVDAMLMGEDLPSIEENHGDFLQKVEENH